MIRKIVYDNILVKSLDKLTEGQEEIRELFEEILKCEDEVQIKKYYARIDNFLMNNEDITTITVEELKYGNSDEEKAKQIKKELENLDKIVDRQWEDYYQREDIEPVSRIKNVIDKKVVLREQLQELANG